MRLSAFLVAALATASLAASDGGLPVADAKKNLEAARAAVTAAVQRIQVEPPANEDLEAAHAAVEALKEAIDAGAAAEQEDLDYARAALAARKELRAQRDFVGQRRAKVHIFAHRRTIDEALKKADAAVRPVAQDKGPSSQAFDDARAALKELKAAADPARQFASQDQGFATYLAQVDATLAKHQKTIDDRFVALSADSHRAKVEEARQALAKAMTGLSSASPDDKFTEADKAVAELEKRLEEGRPLESDKNYRASAERGRAEAADAKKKKDAAWSETGLTRLKADIEPAHKDLQAAARAVRGRKPTEDQLAEARTAAIVVRKLIEKFAPEAARSQAFAQYVDGVKNTLAEVEAQLLLRALESATRDVKAAQRNVERKAPTSEHFAELISALLVLEKTLAPVNPKDPNTSAQVAEAKQVAHDGRWMHDKRRLEVDIELQTARVEDAREVAGKLLEKLGDLGADKLPEVDEAVAAIGKALEGGTELAAKDRSYAAYDREVKRRIEEAKKKLDARRLVLTANDAKTQLSESLAALKAALETAKQPASTDADVDAASKKLDGIVQFIEGHLELEQKAGSYASAAERARNELARQQEVLMFAQAARELRKKTGEMLASAENASRAAAASKDLRAQKAEYEKALAFFKSCNSEGTALMEGNPALLKVVVLVEGSPSTPAAVTKLCAQRAEATVPLLKPLTALIAFDEGPKRSYEKATALLAKGKKTEALAEFDECTATGLTVQYRSPELREKSFEVAGGSMTLIELTRQCTAQAKALRGK